MNNETTIFGKPLETPAEKKAFKNGIVVGAVGAGIVALLYLMSKQR